MAAATAGTESLAGASSPHEKSLGLLATKFVMLLQEAKDGVLDLKVHGDHDNWRIGDKGVTSPFNNGDDPPPDHLGNADQVQHTYY